MEVINRKHSVVQIKQGRVAITVTDKGFYFSTQLVYRAGMKEGMYVHFVTDEKFWGFVINNDPDGFELKSFGMATHNRLTMHSSPVAGMFRKQIGCKKTNQAYYVEPSSQFYLGCPVWNILTSKSISQLLKDN